MQTDATRRTRIFFGLSFIGAGFALQPTLLVQSLWRFYEQQPTAEFLLQSFVILVLYGLAVLAVVLAAFCRPCIKWPLLVIFSLSMATSAAFYSISHMPLEYPDWVMLWRARADVGQATAQYHTAIFWALLSVSPLLLGYLFVPASRRRLGYWTGGVTILSVALFVALCVLKEGRATQRLPSVTNVYGMAIASMFDRPPLPYRYVTGQPPTGVRAADHLALIVDEGTRHDIFAHVVLPEIARRRSTWHIYDFGAATSMADCSSETNIMLRKLVSFDSISRDLYNNPLVWSLAHNAGLTTWLLDAQHHGEGHDYFDGTERALIDHRPDVRTGHDVDLVGVLMGAWSGPPSFSYVIKRGTHFPYSQEYPPSYRSSSAGRKVPYVQANQQRVDAVDSVDYQTGQFFDKLLSTSPKGRVVIFYTADHGLNIADGPGTDHCSSASTFRVEMAMVPLLVLTNFPSDALEVASRRNKNLMSHFDLVATLKDFLGYTSAAARNDGLFRQVQMPVRGLVYGSAFGLFGQPVETIPIDRASYLQLEQERWAGVK